MTTLREPGQVGFGSGELSPEYRNRTDLAMYAHGLALARNFIITPDGMATNRPGFQILREAKYPDKRCVLKPFIFGGGQNYALEFGHLYIRFHQVGGTVMSGGVPYEVVTPYTEDDLPYLKLTQSGDVVVITLLQTHRKELRRVAHANWTLTDFTTAVSLAAPTNLHATSLEDADLTHPGKVWDVYVTAYKGGDTPEESVPSTLLNITVAKALYPDKPAVYAWDPATGADGYNVFRGQGGRAGYIGGTTGSTTFRDDGQIPVYSDPPPVHVDPFAGDVNKEPQVSTFHALRLWFGNSYYAPATLWASQVAAFHNFDSASPPRDQDSIVATIGSRVFDEIRGMLSLSPGLYLFGSSAEWLVLGDQNKAPTPYTVNPQPISYWGSSWLDPVVAGDMPLFVSDLEHHVRELLPPGEGRDLTSLASHLFLEHQIVSWSYARSPFRVVYAVRDDGILLALSYIRQQQQVAWSWQDTDGLFESVCSIPEVLEDSLWVSTQRTVNGVVKRYIERAATRQIDSARWGVFLDGSVFFDGENGNEALTMTLTGGTALAASASSFASDDVGDEIVLLPAKEGGDVRLRIDAYINATHVTVSVVGVLPEEMQSSYVTADWGWGRSDFADLDHLEGANVYALVDGEVLGPYLVESGAISVGRPGVHVAIGRSYYSDWESLDDGYAILKEKLVSRVGIKVVRTATAGLEAGEDFDHLVPYEPPPELDAGVDGLINDLIDVNIESTWNKHGKAVLRQSLPLPVTIAAVVREVTDGDQ